MSQSSSTTNAHRLFSRRLFLQGLGVGSIAMLLGYSRLAKPQPSVFQQDSLQLPYRIDRPLQAIVVGAGLAGLACAYELSQRGFTVTLLEQATQLGGKIASWPIQVNGQSLMMEHGFHGFFPQYYNLNHLVAELGISGNFRSLNSYAVLYRGQNYRPEVFHPNHSAFPWNIVDLAIASPNRLNWGLNLTKPEHWQVFREITGFDSQKSFQRLDQLSVVEWTQQDFPKGLFDLYFLPFAKSTLNAPDLLSAGELMQFFHFYFFGNPEGLAFNGTRQDMGTSLVTPIAETITRNGGRILTGVSVRNLNWQQGRIADLTYQQGGVSDPTPFWAKAIAVSDFSLPHPYSLYKAGEETFAVSSNSQTALSLICPHQGCTVQAGADGKFRCPCHGAQFNAEGQVERGPAQRPLSQFRIAQRRSGQVQLVAFSTPILETIQAEYYVLATDVPGVQRLLTQTTGEVHPQVLRQVQRLAIADPFAVARFWFDRDFPWKYSHFTSLSGYRLTDSITLYHRIQEDYIAWAEATGGSVVELHAYCYKEKEFPDQQALWATFEQELYEIVPELRQATLLHREMVNQKNFSGYPPHSHADRPETRTPVPNLFFAGDWVKMPFPCGLMERAVSSGLLAANSILQQEGLQRRPLLSVQPSGVLSAITPVPKSEHV